MMPIERMFGSPFGWKDRAYRKAMKIKKAKDRAHAVLHEKKSTPEAKAKRKAIKASRRRNR